MGSAGGSWPRASEAAWAGRMEAAVERPTCKQPLWLKVDRAVQRAARVESARMRCALETSEVDQLQQMMTWWMARDAASSGGPATARLLEEDLRSEAVEGETLGALLFSERLHRRRRGSRRMAVRRFPYVSFYGPEDNGVGGMVSEVIGRSRRLVAVRPTGLAWSSIDSKRSTLNLEATSCVCCRPCGRTFKRFRTCAHGSHPFRSPSKDRKGRQRPPLMLSRKPQGAPSGGAGPTSSPWRCASEKRSDSRPRRAVLAL